MQQMFEYFNSADIPFGKKRNCCIFTCFTVLFYSDIIYKETHILLMYFYVELIPINPEYLLNAFDVVLVFKL